MLGVATFLGLIVALAVGTFYRPAVAYTAVVCLYGLKQWGQDSSPWLADHRTVANIVVSIIVAMGLVRANITAIRHVWLISTEWVLALVLYAYALLSLVWTPDLATALLQWQLQAPYIVLIAVLSPFLLSNATDVRRMCDWTIAVGGALCGLALFAGHWGERGLLIAGNAIDQETNPLELGTLGGTVCVMSLLSVASSLPRSKKLLHMLVVPIAIAVLLRSGSRGQLVASVAAVVIGLPLAARRLHVGTWAWIIIVGLLVNALGWWIWARLGVDSARWTSAQFNEDVGNRLAVSVQLLSYATVHPLTLLVGLGNSSAFHFVGMYPHITGLEVLAEEGLLGSSLYVGLLIVAARSTLRLIRIAQIKQETDTTYACAVLAALLLFELFLSFKQGALLSSINVFSYAAILGRMCLIENAAMGKSREGNAVQRPRQLFPNILR